MGIRWFLIGGVAFLLAAGFGVESKGLTATPRATVPGPTATFAPTVIVIAGCPGDCDGSGDVTVGEIILAVNIALELVAPSACPAADADGSGAVEVTEIMAAINALLGDCSPLQGDSFEPDDEPRSATSISCNTTQTRSLVPSGDVDWLTFSLTQPMDVVIETSGDSGETSLTLWDADIAWLDGGSGFSRIHRTCGVNALDAGAYFLDVRGYYDGAEIPRYQIAVTCQPCSLLNPTPTRTSTPTATPTAALPDTYEPDDTSRTAAHIGCGDVQRHTLSPWGDGDWGRLSLSQRTAVFLQTFSPSYISMNLFDPQGNRLGSYFSIDRQCGVDALDPGDYLIELFRYWNSYDSPVGYDLAVVCSPCDQPNATPTPTSTFGPTWTPAATFTPVTPDSYEPDDSRSTARPIASGELQQHTLSPFDDRDWLVVSLPQRAALRIELSSGAGYFNASLSDGSGATLESSSYVTFARWEHNCGTNALEAGSYFVNVSKISSEQPVFGYAVSVLWSPCNVPNPPVTATPTVTPTWTPIATVTPAVRDGFEPDNTSGAAKPIQCGEGQQHTLAPAGDVDWMRLVLSEPSEVHIQATGQSGDSYAALLDVNLLSASGTVIDQAGGAPAHIGRVCGLNALTTGTHRISVTQPYRASVGYYLTVSCAPCSLPNPFLTPTPTASPTCTPMPTATPLSADIFEPDNTDSTAKAIPCDGWQVRTLAPADDVDVIKLVLSERTALRIDVALPPDGSMNAVLRDAARVPLESQYISYYPVQFDRTCGTDALDPGSYYLELRPYYSDTKLVYDVKVLCTPCDVPNPAATPTSTPSPAWTPPPTWTPGTRDQFEPDDVASLAPYTYCGSVQQHSIIPYNDVDWLRFHLTEPSGVVVATNGDTQVSLRNGQQVPIDGVYSYAGIYHLCDAGALAAGDYFLRVSGNLTTGDYQLSLICLPCQGAGSTPGPTFTLTVSPTPTVAPTATATRTPRNTPTPCVTQPCVEPACGNGVVEGDEDCDNGGTCIGGSNAGQLCFAEADCRGDGICIDGPRRFAACSDDDDCPQGRCLHCVPQGGDGCAANCTGESEVLLSLVEGELDGLDFVSGTSGVSIGSDFLSIPLPLAGETVLTIGKRVEEKLPFVIKAAAVRYPAIPVSTLACGCIRGAAAKTCGGTFFEADGVTLATDCSPGTTPGAAVCTAAGKPPCAFLHGAGNTASGEIDCDGEDGINVSVSQDSGGSGGACASPSVCEPRVTISGQGGPGSARGMNSLSITAALGPCSGFDPSTYGADGVFCTADDPTGGLIALTATQPIVTGTATARVRNANGSDGTDLGPVQATGSPFSCTALEGGSAHGAGLTQAFTFVHLDTVGDTVVTATLFAR